MSRAALYPSLKYLKTDSYVPGKKHPVIQEAHGVRDISRIHTKVRLLTGVYVLQVNRSAFNQNQVNPTCLLCKEDGETTEHFILHCSALNHVRQPVPEDLKQTCINLGIEINFGDCEHLLELILDCTSVSSKNSEK